MRGAAALNPIPATGAGVSAAEVALVEEVVACVDCGLVQRIGQDDPERDAFCDRCGRALERRAGRSLDAALACAAAALPLLVLGALLPALRSHLLGGAVEGRVIDAVAAYWRDGFPLMAAFVALFVLAIPVARSSLLVVVLGTLRSGRSGAPLGQLFRWAEAMRLWSTPAVFCLAASFAYARIAAQLTVEVLPGAFCFLVASGLLLVADASLDRRAVWRAIHPEARRAPPGDRIGCDACGLVLAPDREARPCPRCARVLRRRKPDSLKRTAALTAAALLLYFPAILLPMTRTEQPQGEVTRNVVDGVTELVSRGFWVFAAVVVIASVAIPLVKLIGLGWFMLRAWRPRRRTVVFRTRAHRAVDEINRWSFVDPFIVAATAPIMAYPGVADVRAGPGATAFALVVALTMLASQWFDNRLMWDGLEETPS